MFKSPPTCKPPTRLTGAGEAPRTPADVLLGGRSAGRLTSAAGDGPGWIGLAVLRPAACETGAQLEIGDRTIREVLPFPPSLPLGLP